MSFRDGQAGCGYRNRKPRRKYGLADYEYLGTVLPLPLKAGRNIFCAITISIRSGYRAGGCICTACYPVY